MQKNTVQKNTVQDIEPKNTVQDFLDTIKEAQVDIICPACGTPMGIKQQGSYEMVLTENARKEINDILNLYRRYLQGLETELETLNIHGFKRTEIGNYPYRDRKEEKLDDALYKTAGSKDIKAFIQDKLDYYNWSGLLHGGKIPTLTKLEQLNNGQSISSDSDEETLYVELMKVMIGGGFEPDLIISHIMSLVFDQYQVKVWMDQTKLEEHEKSKELRQELSKCCPRIYGYVSRIETFIKNADASLIKKLAVQLGKEAITKEQLIEDITRCLYIVVLLFGHKSQQIDSLSGSILKHQVTFDLGKYVVVSPMRLKEIVLSGVIAKRTGLRWKKDFLGILKGQGADDKNNKEIFDSLMRGEISKLVNFACTGQSGNKGKESTYHEGKEPQCGWYPKSTPTHPVVLIGSPGTGKSTVMLTGLTTFYSNAQALGTRVTFTSDEDVDMLKQYTKDFWEGILPKPNKEGTRYSVQLTVESTRNIHEREHFVFTDIPGEVAARSLTKEGTDPVVLGVLKHTKTIIFFFDLSIEPSILTPLINGTNKEDAWKSLKESYEQTKEERQGRSEISQIQLLNKLIHDLREIRGEEDLKNINFVCVIPKSDLFVDEDEKTTKFFTEFYEELYNKEKCEGLLIQSRYTPDDETFTGRRTVAGIGSIKYDEAEPMNSQLHIIDIISEKATNHLKNIGDALGADAVEADKTSLKSIVLGLISTLEIVFGENNVYILPVSAQGEKYFNTSSQDDGQSEERKKLKHPPNQKLSEYVFIIPVVLAMPQS